MQHDCLHVEEITMEKKYLIILSTVIISLAGAVGLIYCAYKTSRLHFV